MATRRTAAESYEHFERNTASEFQRFSADTIFCCKATV
jgi:hypothetical protein